MCGGVHAFVRACMRACVRAYPNAVVYKQVFPFGQIPAEAPESGHLGQVMHELLDGHSVQ